MHYDEFELGFSWLPDDALTRTSHAIDGGDGVWLVDPVDVPDAIDRAAALGTPVGVLQLLDRHGRGVHGPAAAEALADAYARARSDLPRLAWRLPGMARAAVATRRPT